MTYTRYVVARSYGNTGGGVFNPFQQSQFNAGGLAGVAGNLADAAVTTLTGNRFLGDLSGAVVSNLL